MLPTAWLLAHSVSSHKWLETYNKPSTNHLFRNCVVVSCHAIYRIKSHLAINNTETIYAYLRGLWEAKAAFKPVMLPHMSPLQSWAFLLPQQHLSILRGKRKGKSWRLRQRTAQHFLTLFVETSRAQLSKCPAFQRNQGGPSPSVPISGLLSPDL